MVFSNRSDFYKWKLSDDIKKLYIAKMLEALHLSTLDEFFEIGYSIHEIENNLNNLISNEIINEFDVELRDKQMSRLFPCREILSQAINERFGSVKAYMHSPQFVKRKVQIAGDTMEAKYGYRNPGQSPEHKEKMSSGVKCKNPFASEQFNLISYVRGKTVLPEQKHDFDMYRAAVTNITKENRQFIEFTGFCYYTGQQIYKCNGKDNIDRNSYNCACLDHKISVLYGFLHGISPEIIGSVNNLCWTSRFFNSSIKKDNCESQLLADGTIQRYKEILERLEKINDSK